MQFLTEYAETTSAPVHVKRLPHLGYTLPFLLSAWVLLSVAAYGLYAVGVHWHMLPVQAGNNLTQHPRLSLLAMAIGYLGTLTWAILLYPIFWERGFFDVMQWNFAAVREHWKELVSGGVAMSIAVALGEKFISIPDKTPMDEFFRNPTDVWIVTLFGTLLAPFFEELCFRGFLLPAISIACDWLADARGQRTEDASSEIRRIEDSAWRFPESVRPASLGFAACVTSIGFAFLHANQLAHAWGAVFLLFCVSCVLTAVRIHLRSVAASTLLHAAYNSTVFGLLFIATGGYRHLERMHR